MNSRKRPFSCKMGRGQMGKTGKGQVVMGEMGIGRSGHWAKWGLGEVVIWRNENRARWILGEMVIGWNGNGAKWWLGEMALGEMTLGKMEKKLGEMALGEMELGGMGMNRIDRYYILWKRFVAAIKLLSWPKRSRICDQNLESVTWQRFIASTSHG